MSSNASPPDDPGGGARVISRRIVEPPPKLASPTNRSRRRSLGASSFSPTKIRSCGAACVIYNKCLPPIARWPANPDSADPRLWCRLILPTAG